MKRQSVSELNKKMEQYLEQGDYDKVEEISRELCRIQGLETADKMPEDFLYQLKRKEKQEMGIMKKFSKRAIKIAASAAAVLLVGGTVSAAVVYQSGVKQYEYGLTTGEGSLNTESEFQDVKLTETPEEKTLVEETAGEKGGTWVNKKVWEETHTSYESDEGVNWTPVENLDRITEYSYETYDAAAEDAGFEKVFEKDFSGAVTYTEYEHINPESETDYVIDGTFSYGKGTFTVQQSKVENAAEGEYTVITGESTGNERDYVSKTGYVYKLSDDRETGTLRTTTMAACDNYWLVFTFTGMTEEEIHEILDMVNIAALIDLSQE